MAQHVCKQSVTAKRKNSLMETACKPKQPAFQPLGRREVDQRIDLRVDLFLESYREPPHEIWLALDAAMICVGWV